MREYPLLEEMPSGEEVFWTNPRYDSFESALGTASPGREQIRDAAERLRRFGPYIARAFPETAKSDGLIESPLVEAPALQRRLDRRTGYAIQGGCC